MEPKIVHIIKAISDVKSLELFRIVGLTKPNTEILVSKTKLTRKQYYSRMASLMNAGLVKRKNGKYTLSALGKVIYYSSVATIENAVTNYWKLKAIDSLEMSKDLPAEERKKIIDNFIDNQGIKAILESDFQSTADTWRQQQRTYKIKSGILVP
jgi:predicted transcriptional regulator